MKTADYSARQGEAFFIRVDSVPEGCRKVSAEKGTYVISHSETGHNHTTDAHGKMIYQCESDPLVCYLVMETAEYADIVHHRSFDTHETIRLLGGQGAVWRRTLQREWSPEGWKQVMD